jgi:glycosyltransferase involved in cell wall biosynthesis
VAQVVGAVNGAYWIVPICAGLKDRGHSVTAIIGAEEGDLAPKLRAEGIPYVHYPQHLGSQSPLLARVGSRGRYALHGGAFLRNAGRLARVLRRLDIEVVHSHVFTSILLARVAGWMARTPIRISHVPGPFHLEAQLPRRMDQSTLWMDHQIVGGSRRVEDLYAVLGVPAERRRHIYYGPDPTRFDPTSANPGRVRRELGISPTAPLIGQVAFFYPVMDNPFTPKSVRGLGVKGQSDVVEAARLVLREVPEAHLLLVGGGWDSTGEADRQELIERTRRLGLARSITFLDSRTDVPDVLAALDVSIQASLNENLGGTVESLLMARPTIATRVGGMPEAVIHERTGLLVPPRDPPAIAAAILRMIREREHAAELAKEGRRLMLERFTKDRTVQDVEELYAELAEKLLPAGSS